MEKRLKESEIENFSLYEIHVAPFFFKFSVKGKYTKQEFLRKVNEVFLPVTFHTQDQ